MNPIFLLLIAVMTLMGSLGAFFFKKVSEKQDGFHLLSLIKTPALYFGGVLYVLSAGINILLLRFIDYTLLYPMTALTYVWTLLISSMVLHEKMNREKILAILFIGVGIVLLNL
jgi:drug/metabolite transporter (DMT)-like permease